MTPAPSRKLLLLRHAKSAWPSRADHDRPLARRGQRDAPMMGRWLHAAGHVPDQVLCSTARRARETWQLSQAGLAAAAPVAFCDQVYQGTAAQLLDLIHDTDPAVRALLLVGHDPALPALALMLAAGDDTPASDDTQGGTPQGVLAVSWPSPLASLAGGATPGSVLTRRRQPGHPQHLWPFGPQVECC